MFNVKKPPWGISVIHFLNYTGKWEVCCSARVDDCLLNTTEASVETNIVIVANLLKAGIHTSLC